MKYFPFYYCDTGKSADKNVPVNYRFILIQPEHPLLWISGLGEWSDCSYFDETEAQLFEAGNSLSVLVEAGSEADWMSKFDPAKLGRLSNEQKRNP